MARKEKELKELIREWSSLPMYGTRNIALRTAVFLTRVNEVPNSVVYAMNKIADLDFHNDATHVQTIFRFLLELQEIERMTSIAAKEGALAEGKGKAKEQISRSWPPRP